MIRDYGPGDALNFGGAPIAYVTGGDTSITIVLDTVARDVVRIEAPGGLTFNDIRIRPVPLGVGTAPADTYTYATTSNRLTQVQFVGGDTRTLTDDAAGSTTGDLRTVGAGSDDWGYESASLRRYRVRLAIHSLTHVPPTRATVFCQPSEQLYCGSLTRTLCGGFPPGTWRDSSWKTEEVFHGGGGTGEEGLFQR